MPNSSARAMAIRGRHWLRILELRVASGPCERHLVVLVPKHSGHLDTFRSATIGH